MYWHLLFHISSCWRNIHVLPIFRDILVYRVHGMLFNIHMTARFPFLLCLFDILMLRNSNLKKKELCFRENLHAVDFKRAPPQRTGTDMDPSSKSSIRFVENGNLLYLIIWRCFTSLLKCIDNSIIADSLSQCPSFVKVAPSAKDCGYLNRLGDREPGRQSILQTLLSR